MNQDLLTNVNEAISTYRMSFYLWSFVFYILCVGMIVLPIIVSVAAEALGNTWVRILAAASAICASITTWAGLNIAVANFRNSFTMLEVARAESMIHPDNDKLLVVFAKAKELVGSYSPGVPQTGNNTPTGR